jgi:hypothetical protein
MGETLGHRFELCYRSVREADSPNQMDRSPDNFHPHLLNLAQLYPQMAKRSRRKRIMPLHILFRRPIQHQFKPSKHVRKHIIQLRVRQIDSQTYSTAQ